jgi:hypothetical protein
MVLDEIKIFCVTLSVILAAYVINLVRIISVNKFIECVLTPGATYNTEFWLRGLEAV